MLTRIIAHNGLNLPFFIESDYQERDQNQVGFTPAFGCIFTAVFGKITGYKFKTIYAYVS